MKWGMWRFSRAVLLSGNPGRLGRHLNRMAANSNRRANSLGAFVAATCFLLSSLKGHAASVALPGSSQTNSYRLAGTNRASLSITTNFYRFGGTNHAQMRAAMNEARPWKQTQNFDALTKWDVFSTYRFRREGEKFVLDTVDVRTKVVIPLPWWTPGKPVARDLVERWNRCLIGLNAHERGHLALAEAAGNEVKKQLLALAASASRQELSSAAERAIADTLEEFRRRERRYDEVTGHGFTQGAIFATDARAGP